MAHDAERTSRLKNSLRENNLDAIVTPFASEVLLLSGFWPVMADSIAFFTHEGEVRVVVPEDEQELAASTSSAHLTPYKPETLHRLTTPAEALFDPLKQVVSDLGLYAGRLGVQTSQGVQPASYAVSTIFRDSLRGILHEIIPNATLVPCDHFFEEQKAVKTPVELDQMRLAARIAADGFARAPLSIGAGLREPEVAARIQTAFDTSPEAHNAERSYGFFFCMSGPNSAKASAAFARTRHRNIEAGDLVMIHANTCCNGYWTDITRTYTAGQPVERHEKMRAAILAARSAALSTIRPGVPAHDVDHAAREVMESHGFGNAFRHAVGHGVGFAAANANARPRMHPESPDVLAEGMTFNIEPAAYFDDYGGMRHCDVVAVTATGAEVLTDF